MSYELVLQGLEERIRTVAGILYAGRGEPSVIQVTPSLYSTFIDADRSQTGQITVMVYRTAHSVWIQWQDNASAEREVADFINALPAAVDQDGHLGGRITSGMAKVSRVVGSYPIVNGTRYRVLDFTSEVTDKAPYGSGI